MAAQAQLAELTRICPQVFALIDSEKSDAKTPVDEVRLSFRESCTKLGIKCHILKRRSMENYLSDRAIKQVLGPTAQALGHFDPAPGALKAMQAKIAARMTESEISGTDLGVFLSAVLE